MATANHPGDNPEANESAEMATDEIDMHGDQILKHAFLVLQDKPWLVPGKKLFSNSERERMIRTREAKEASFRRDLSGYFQ